MPSLKNLYQNRNEVIREIVCRKIPEFHQALSCNIAALVFASSRGKRRIKKFMSDHIRGKRAQKKLYGEPLVK